MVSLQVSMVTLWWTLGAFLLNQLTVNAQKFVPPAVDTNPVGNLSESVDFVWTYTTPNIARTAINCEVNMANVVFKRASAGTTAAIQGVFVGRATAIDDTTSSPYRIGFRLNNLTFSDASNYHCSLSYDGGPLIRSRVYRLKIYERPRFINCLEDGLFGDAAYFYLQEGGVLNSTCYVYGSPVPTLDCRTYDYANIQQDALSPVTRNYTSLPLTNRMLFYLVKRRVTKVRCVADGNITGKIFIEKEVRVDFLAASSGDDRGISNGTIFLLIVALPLALILLIIVGVNVRKKMKEEPEYPESYVEEDVDYNSGNDGLYATVNKKKPDYNENAPTSGVPFTIHQGKTRRSRNDYDME